MKQKRIVSMIAVCCMCFGPVRVGYSESFENTNAGKAAKEALGAMTWLLNDWAEINNLPLEQKIKVVQKNAQKRIWDKMKDQQWGVTKTAISAYAKQKMRQGLFQEATAAMMHKCVVEGKSVAAVWSAVDADLTVKIDSNMKAFGYALDAVEISYTAYKKWNEGKPGEALTDMGKAVADKVIEFMVPGWGYYRLAQSVVEALGKWVMQYAFDTALEGKINQILPSSYRTNPEKFAEWILSINVASYVSREWDEQIGYGGWYAKYDGDDKTKDEFGEGMKKKIIANLERLQNDARVKKDIADQIRAKYEEQDRLVREAERAVQEATKGVMQQIEDALKPLAQYEERVYGLKRQDAQEAVETVTEQYQEAAAKVPDASAYSPMNRESVINALKDMYDQVGPSFAIGYDLDEIIKYRKLYDAIRAEELAKIKPQIEQADKKIIEARTAQFKAIKPISDQISAISKPYGWGQVPQEARNRLDALYAKKDEVYAAYQVAVTAAQNKKSSILTLSAQDKARLATEENLVVAEAAVRFDSMMKQLKVDLAEIQADLDQATEEFRERLAAFDEAKKKLHYGDRFEWIRNEHFIASGFPPVTASSPQDVQSAARAVRAELEKWKEDARHAPGIENMRAAAYSQYRAAYEQAKNRFKGLVNEKGREMGDEDSDDVRAWKANVYNFVEGVDVPIGTFVVRLPYISFHSYNKPDVTGRYAKKVKALEDHLRELEHFEPAADLGVYFWRIFNETDLSNYRETNLKRLNMEAMCERKGEEFGFSVDPDESDGAVFIEKMKEDWVREKDKVMALKRIHDEYLKVAGGFTFKYMDLRQNTLLDHYVTIPDWIKEYEAILDTVKEQRQQMFANLKNDLARYQEHFAEYTKIVDFRERLPQLHALRTRVFASQAKFSARGITGVPKDSVAAVEQLEVFLASLDDYIQKIDDDVSRGVFAESDTRLPDTHRQSYALSNVMLNTIPAQMVLPEQVMTSADLVKGSLRVSGRLSTVEGISSMRITNGAGDEKKLKKAEAFTYECKAQPQARYRFILHLETALGRTIELDLFPHARDIRYEDIDFEQQVVTSINALAQSYEEANVAAFTDLVSREYFGSKSMLEEGARFDFMHFTNLKLRIGIRRIERRRDLFVAETEWQRMQTLTKTGDSVERSGRTTLMFVYEDGRMRIKNMRGELLFASLSPDIAQAQGISQRDIDRIRSERETVLSGGSPPVAAGDGTDSDPDPDVPPAASVESGSFALTQYTAHPMAPGTVFAESYDFARKQVVKDYDIDLNGDFRRREGWIEAGRGAGVRELAGGSINAITEVPASGYQSAVGTRMGALYALQRADGTFALIEFVSANGDSPDLYAGRPVVSQFRYRYQRNGTRMFD
jgi:hypothetical protein